MGWAARQREAAGLPGSGNPNQHSSAPRPPRARWTTLTPGDFAALVALAGIGRLPLRAIRPGRVHRQQPGEYCEDPAL